MQRLIKFAISTNLKLHYPGGISKQFKIPYHSTSQEVLNIIKSEEKHFNKMDIMINDKPQALDIPFLDLVLHNSPELIIDNVNYSYEVDLNGAAPYYQNSELEEAFSAKEIPYFDALVISRFHESLKSHLGEKQLYTPTEIRSALQKTITSFSEDQATNSQYWSMQQNILQGQDQMIAYFEEIVSQVEKEAEKEGHSLLKKLIIFALMQYFFLMYLTYGVYDWGVSEPISYLLAQSMETIAILYFLRKGYAFKQTNLFKNKFDATFNSLINKKTNSTNFMRSLHFARRRAELTEAKLIYGTTSL